MNETLRQTLDHNAERGILLGMLGDHERANALRDASRKLIYAEAEAKGVPAENVTLHMHVNEREVLSHLAAIGGFYTVSHMPAARALVEAVLTDLRAWAVKAHADDVAVDLYDGERGNFNIIPELREEAWAAGYLGKVDEMTADPDPSLENILRLARKAYPVLDAEDSKLLNASLATTVVSGKIEDAMNALTRLAGQPGFANTAKAVMGLADAMAALGRDGNLLHARTGSGMFYTFDATRESALNTLRSLVEHIVAHGSDEGFDADTAKAALEALDLPDEPPLNDKDKAALSEDEAALDRLLAREAA